MAARSIFEDNRLDVVILGPMGKKGKQSSTSAAIGQAVERVLAEPRAQALLEAGNTKDFQVHIPENWDDTEVINGVLSRLDIADLVIINLTPAGGPAGAPSANVYYELGLVHAMGIPFILLYQSGTEDIFYLRSTRNYRVADFDVDTVTEALRTPIQKFIDLDDDTDFADNRVTQFYEHLPVADISAAVGLATGYYYNFVGRMLRDGSFISAYPDLVKRLIIVRPSNVMETFEADQLRLRATLAKAGFTLTETQLSEPPGDKKGGAFIFHVDGIVVDLPRMIYPLKHSPKLLSMQDRFDKQHSSAATAKQKDRLLRQASERMLERVERVIRYHVRKAPDGYRRTLLHFARIEDVPGLLREFGAASRE